MFFSSIKELNRLLKEINRLLSKEMPNIYLKVTIRKKWRTQNFNFTSIKSSSPGQFFEELPTHEDIIEFSSFFLQLKSQGSGRTTVCDFSIMFYF